jgi:hypothetical protein
MSISQTIELSPVLQAKLNGWMVDQYQSEIIILARMLEFDDKIRSDSERADRLKEWATIKAGTRVSERVNFMDGIIDPASCVTLPAIRPYIDEILHSRYGADAKHLLLEAKPAFSNKIKERRNGFADKVAKALEKYLTAGGMTYLGTVGEFEHAFYADDWYVVFYIAADHRQVKKTDQIQPIAMAMRRVEEGKGLKGREGYGVVIGSSIAAPVISELENVRLLGMGIRSWLRLQYWLDKHTNPTKPKHPTIKRVIEYAADNLFNNTGILDVEVVTSNIDLIISSS